MKKLNLWLFLFITGIFFTGNASAVGPFGQITIKTCYQQFSVQGSTTYNMIAGTDVIFGISQGIDFSEILIAPVNDLNLTVAVPLGTRFYLMPGVDYIFQPFLGTNAQPYEGWNPSILVTKPVDILQPSGCAGFNELVDFGPPPFEGLCDWDLQAESPNGDITTLRGQNIYDAHKIRPPADYGKIRVSDGEFCTPGMDWVGLRCTEIKITINIRPCDQPIGGNPNCPDIKVTRLINFCCDNCVPRTAPNSWKTAPTLGIAEEYAKEVFRIYPNPANAIVTLNTPEGVTISIYGVNGQHLKTLQTESLTTFIDVKEWSAGLYLVKFETVKGVVSTQRLSISR